jgi:arsenite methyltransferase
METDLPDRATTHEQVREYYARTLKTAADLKTSACCPIDAIPLHIRPLVEKLDPEVIERSYGCGSPIPDELEGRTVLDLGCGTGRDVFVASQLVGEQGAVIGLDMTAEQLEVGERLRESHAERFGHSRSNVRFVQGVLEDLGAAGIERDSVDVVISNCVLNLAPDKRPVLEEIVRVLKPGGELYFSDVFTDRRLPPELARDPVLVGECLGGALYMEDFRRLMAGVGLLDHRTVASGVIELEDPAVVRKAGMATFFSHTVRAFHLASLEDRCEDFGQVATYRGTIPHAPHSWRLDDHHEFETGRPMLVCGNTAAMLSETRFSAHFEVVGDRSTHFGLFDCGPGAVPGPDTGSAACC